MGPVLARIQCRDLGAAWLGVHATRLCAGPADEYFGVRCELRRLGCVMLAPRAICSAGRLVAPDRRGAQSSIARERAPANFGTFHLACDRLPRTSMAAVGVAHGAHSRFSVVGGRPVPMLAPLPSRRVVRLFPATSTDSRRSRLSSRVVVGYGSRHIAKPPGRVASDNMAGQTLGQPWGRLTPTAAHPPGLRQPYGRAFSVPPPHWACGPTVGVGGAERDWDRIGRRTRHCGHDPSRRAKRVFVISMDVL